MFLTRRFLSMEAAAAAMPRQPINVALIPGDGIGPEIAAAVVRVLAAAKVPIKWEEVNVSPVITAAGQTAIPEAALRMIRQHRYALKGPLATPIGRGHVSLNLTLRRALNLYANVRPARSIAGFKTLYDAVDTVVIRENTEGEYSGIEHEVVRGVMQSVKLITRSASERVARFGFQYARDCGRNHVTIVHKAAIMYDDDDGMLLVILGENLMAYFSVQPEM